MPLQRRVVPNHFRSLRTPSQSPTSGAGAAGFESNVAVGQDTSKYGRIPDFTAMKKKSTQPSVAHKATKTSFSPYEASSSSSSPVSPRPASRQRGKTSPASVVDNFVAAAAEARIAAHARLLAERRAAEEADAALIAAEKAAAASTTKAAHWASKRPQLTINTAPERTRSPQYLSGMSPGSQAQARAGTSPLSRGSSATTPTQSPSSSPRLNDGSARYRPNASAEDYRIVLAEEHTDLYAWLLSRQKNFWGSRGL